MASTVNVAAADRPRLRALRAAIPYTLPIFASFWFLGLTYGLYMRTAGFSFWYPLLMSMLIFAGSMEFVTVSLLLSAFDPVQALLLTLMINARHLFYGLSLLDKYKGLGWKKPLLIFALCDETFSINYAVQTPAGVDRGWFMLWVTILNYAYWVSGAALGGLCGPLLPFDATGLDFAMTAMFTVIFLEQWFQDKQHVSALLGLALTLVSLLLLGADSFIVPAMLAILLSLTLARKPLERRLERAETLAATAQPEEERA